jgi:hypothetical protein
MLDTGFVVDVAILGVVLAGFASLMFAFRGTSDLEVRAAWRIRFVMTSGFNAAMAALGMVAIAAYTDDQELLVRLAMALVLLITLTPLPWALRSLRGEEVFRTQGERVSWLIGEALFRLVALVNLFVASVPLLVVLFVLWIVGVITVYLNGAAEVYPRADSRGVATPAG